MWQEALLIGSLTNLMLKKDPATTGKFWLELIGLVSGKLQLPILVGDATPIANSPAFSKRLPIRTLP
jgi:hypothetical protein